MTSAVQDVAPEVDPLEQFEKPPSVSFDPTRINDAGEAGHAMGEWVYLEVEGYLELVDRRDDKKQIMRYEDTGNPMKSIVLKVRENGIQKALWGKKPGGLFSALVAAQAALKVETGEQSRRIRPGDLLAVRWSALGDQPENKMYSRPKIFDAKVKPGTLPVGTPVNTSDNPFESAASTPAPAQPAPAQPQPRPAVGGDPWATSAPAAPAQPAPSAAAAAPAVPQPAAPAPSAPASVAGAEDDPFGAPPAGETPPY